jgi:hypothetical protein
MKKRIPFLVFSSAAISGLAFGYSSWVAAGTLFNVGETNKVSEASAYIHNFSSGTLRYFTTIEGALTKAVSGEMVVAIPPSDSAYYPTDSDDRRAASERTTVNWSSLTTLKTSYTVNRDCTVKEGVTFVLPNASIVSAVTSSSTLSTYIEGMKNGTKQSSTDGIFYKKDASGNYLAGSTVVDSAAKASVVYSFHRNFATAHENVFLRTTVSLAEGVTLHNQGTIVVAGLLSQGDSSYGVIGHTSHSYSRLLLGKDAKIVQDTAASKTYCYGYISEASSNNGSLFSVTNGTVYVPFIVDDYRGFTHSWAMTSGAITTERSSPFNQIEFRNIDTRVVFYYNAMVYGIVNNMVIYDSMSVNQSFMKEISLVGNTTSFAFQLTDSAFSSLAHKYNVSTQVAQITATGGLNLNPITNLEFKESIVDVNLSTTEAYFPFSYHWDISLAKATTQSAATFAASVQRFKLLPGANLYVGDGCTLNVKSVVVYSAFYDGALGRGEKSACDYSGVSYPLKDGASLRVADTGAIVATSLAGKVYGSASNITYTTGQITSKEAWNVKSSGSINPPWVTDDYLEIRETIDISPLADFTKSKLFIGLNTFSNYSSYTPALNVIKNPNDASTTTTTNVDNYQKVILSDSFTNYSIDFVRDVYRSYYYTSYYTKSQVVPYSANNNKYGAISSTSAISNNNGGVNEFNVQSVTVTCSTPLVNGNIPLYVGSSVTLNAAVVDITKSYNKTITWTSSNTSVATVNSSGSVTGVALGTVTITATCDGVSGSMVLTVIPEQTVTAISSITITDNNGNSSAVTAGSSTFGGSASVNYNGKYGNNKTITFTLNINPTGAPYQSILWTFAPSATGRQTFNGSALTTASNVTTVTVQTVSGTGPSDDKATLTCQVIDLNNNTFTATFVINHQADTSCVVEGTLLTMADGSHKKVEDLQIGDSIMVFDHFTGRVTASPLCFNAHSTKKATRQNVIHLLFDNGQEEKITFEHGFFDVVANKYVYIDETNYESMVGRQFVSIDATGHVSKTTLISAYSLSQVVRVFSPITFSTLNIVTNDMLSIAGDMRGVFNIFELDQDMKVDPLKMKEDIDKFGLYSYEEWSSLITPLQFQAFNVQYLKVSIGKELTTYQQLLRYIHDYMD